MSAASGSALHGIRIERRRCSNSAMAPMGASHTNALMPRKYATGMNVVHAMTGQRSARRAGTGPGAAAGVTGVRVRSAVIAHLGARGRR
jgi:hypothetical protein